MARKSFYEADSGTSYLREGFVLEVKRQLTYHGEHADFKPFLDVPIKELMAQLKDSRAQERKVQKELEKVSKAWDEYGSRTLLLRKAIEYLQTPEVSHTANEWRQRKDGSWEISNLVYKMTFEIVQAGGEWRLTWDLSYTAPGLSQGYWGYTRTPRERIEHEGSKKYKTLAGAQKYIQSRFDQYAHCFEALSPPILVKAKELFCVNGQLLQGYSLVPSAPEKERITLDELLDCLEDVAVTKAAPEQEPAAPEPRPPVVQPFPAPKRPPRAAAKSPPRKERLALVR